MVFPLLLLVCRPRLLFARIGAHQRASKGENLEVGLDLGSIPGRTLRRCRVALSLMPLN